MSLAAFAAAGDEPRDQNRDAVERDQRHRHQDLAERIRRGEDGRDDERDDDEVAEKLDQVPVGDKAGATAELPILALFLSVAGDRKSVV